MKKLYEKFRLLCGLLAIGWLVCFCFTGCRSYRHTEEHRDRQELATYREQTAESITVDTTATTYQERDTITGATVERGGIEIKRDSTGLPLSIVWFRTTNFGVNRQGQAAAQSTGRSISTTRCSETADSVADLKQTTTETEKETKVAAPLEMRIALAIVVLIIVFYIGDYLYRLWKRLRSK